MPPRAGGRLTKSSDAVHHVVLSSSTPSVVDDDATSCGTDGCGGLVAQDGNALAQEVMAARRALEDDIRWYDAHVFALETAFLAASAELSNGGGGGLLDGLHLPKGREGGTAVGLGVKHQHRLVSTVAMSTPPPTAAIGSGGVSGATGGGGVRMIPIQERVFTMASVSALASVDASYAKLRRGLARRKRFY